VKCKVLLVGEGVSDIGDLAIEPPYRKGREGFLQPLLRSMVGDRAELEFEGRKLLHLPKEPRRRHRAGKLQAENASRALAFASALDMNALVLSCDTDKTLGTRAKRVERQRRLRELRESVKDGFAFTREDDKDAGAIQTAIAIPCRMIEAWALGDRESLAVLLSKSARDLNYGDPEELWGGEDDPDSDHPKCVWQRVTDGGIDFAEIGAAATPSALAKACPDSFPPFAEDVERALDECPVTGDERPPRTKAVVARRRGGPAKVVRRRRSARR
jgi:hypothetical protein